VAFRRRNILEDGYSSASEAGDRLLSGAEEAWLGVQPMTRLTGTCDPKLSTMPASPQRARKTRKHSPMRWLADPRGRLGLGTAAVLVTALSARRNRVGQCEAQAFRAVNGLPDSLYGPVWVIMQLGTLGAAPAAAGAALLAHDRALAGRLLAGGTGTWALSKLVKQMVRRPRPAALVSGTHTRGRDASGLGYLSGHAGVAVALGTAAFPRLGPSGRAVVAAAVPIVGLSRIYVGAHLPLDVAGGAALGLAVDAAVALVRHPSGHKNQPDVRRFAPSRCAPARTPTGGLAC
jgi:membrane-associated phospholipid phosphatase